MDESIIGKPMWHRGRQEGSVPFPCGVSPYNTCTKLSKLFNNVPSQAIIDFIKKIGLNPKGLIVNFEFYKGVFTTRYGQFHLNPIFAHFYLYFVYLHLVSELVYSYTIFFFYLKIQALVLR